MRLCGEEIGADRRIFLNAGPCAIERESLALSTAETLNAIAEPLGILLLYKSSLDKANRSSGKSPRGRGIEEGLRILEKVRSEVGVPV